MPRTLSELVATSPACRPLLRARTLAIEKKWRRWDHAQKAFLEAMWGFDQNVANGSADQGDNQNGKGDFLNDLLCILLENCSGKSLWSRPSVAGRIFPRHNLDGAYPQKGDVKVFIETKAFGAPKSPRNKKQKNPLGRRGSADMDKRIKEAGLKTIDLKAEFARVQGRGGGPTGDFISWLHAVEPHCYLLLAVRTIDDNDLKRAVALAGCAKELMDGCGLFCFSPADNRYLSQPVPRNLEMDQVVSRICDQLHQLPG